MRRPLRAAGGASGAAAEAAFTDMQAAADASAPFTAAELDALLASLANVGLDGGRAAAVRGVLARCATANPKDWSAIEALGRDLARALPPRETPEHAAIFRRPLGGGGWAGAVSAAAARPAAEKPWAILVTGLNGIRKTTSFYQPWFRDALAEALVGPGGGAAGAPPPAPLPGGDDVFFRQLDYVVAAACNDDFSRLYSVEAVDAYAAAKAAIFARYRSVAEAVGAALVADAVTKRCSVALETSGRDLGMFGYVDHFFDDDAYHKLVLNFEIEGLEYAERSVGSRMEGEMAAGRAAVASGDADAVVGANAGGPYGPGALAGVQAASRAVWAEVASGDAGVGATWYRASFRVTPSDDGPWTLAAAADGATAFPFAPLGRGS
jgi:hypothetical protein